MTDALNGADTDQGLSRLHDEGVQEVKIRARQQAAIAELGHLALRGVDLSTLFAVTTDRLVETLHLEYSKVLECNPDGQTLLLKAGRGWRPGLIGTARVDAGDGSQAGYTLLRQAPVVVEDLRTETRFDGPQLLIDHGVVSGMSVVIMDVGKPYGVLGVHSRERRTFTPDDVNFLVAIANVLGAAVVRARIEERLRESQRHYRSLFDSALDAVLVLDERGQIVDANASAADLSGYPTSHLLRLRLEDLLPSERGDLGCEMWRALKSSGHLSGEHLLRRRDGTTVHVEVSAVRLEDGRYQSLLRDISERKRTAHFREEFLNLAAHELLTPLTTLRGLTQLLLRRSSEDAEQAKLLKALKAQGDRMSQLVQTLLDVTQLQHGDFVLLSEIVDLSSLAEGVVREARASSPLHQITVSRTERVLIRGDRRRLRVVLFHLLDNATKYSPNGGHIAVCLEVRDERAVVKVRDWGLGIPEDKQAQLFQAFYQVAPMVRPTTGMGLGLYTCREIVSRHGGKMWFESQEGRGSTFAFELPIASSSASSSQR